MKIELFQSIKFKLALLNTVFFYVFCLLFVLLINIYVQFVITQDPLFQLGGEDEVINEVLERRLADRFPLYEQLTRVELQRIADLRRADLNRLRVVSLYSLIPTAFVSFGLGYFLAGRLLRPLNSLSSSIANLEPSNLSQQLIYTGDDNEIGLLINNYNQMVQRLESAFTSQSEFVSNASHELKTPLAIVQANLESLIFNAENLTAQELKLNIETALTAVTDLNNLLENLLVLTNSTHPEFVDVDLVLLSKVVVTELTSFAEERGVNLSIEIEDKNMIVSSDKYRLTRIIKNLVENAIKYSDDSKSEPTVTINCISNDSEVFLEIIDNGIGIAAEEEEKIFHRFYQIDKSRARTSNIKSYGLGLALVAKYCAELTIGINLESALAKGTKFSLIIPKRQRGEQAD